MAPCTATSCTGTAAKVTASWRLRPSSAGLALDEFTSGNFEFGGSVGAIAITASASASAGTSGTSAAASGGKKDAATAGEYHNGMVVFTIANSYVSFNALADKARRWIGQHLQQSHPARSIRHSRPPCEDPAPRRGARGLCNASAGRRFSQDGLRRARSPG